MVVHLNENTTSRFCCTLNCPQRSQGSFKARVPSTETLSTPQKCSHMLSVALKQTVHFLSHDYVLINRCATLWDERDSHSKSRIVSVSTIPYYRTVTKPQRIEKGWMKAQKCRKIMNESGEKRLLPPKNKENPIHLKTWSTKNTLNTSKLATHPCLLMCQGPIPYLVPEASHPNWTVLGLLQVVYWPQFRVALL